MFMFFYLMFLGYVILIKTKKRSIKKYFLWITTDPCERSTRNTDGINAELEMLFDVLSIDYYFY